MSYVVLARKYRPQSFEDLVGQEHVAVTLANAIAQNRVAHAFLFTGVRGVGKTTSARLLAKCLNCLGADGTAKGPTATPCQTCSACTEIAAGTDMDVQEIDGASYNGVDEVRRLQEGLAFRPARDRYKIFIVDEVHMLSTAAWNAFLKTLEEPPPHVKFIFATTEVHKVPITILSRCQRYDFKLIPTLVIAKRLSDVLGVENIKADKAAIAALSREAAGSMRDAMSLLDQVIAFSGDNVTSEDVVRVLGIADRKVLHDLVAALFAGDAARVLSIMDSLATQGFDLIHVAKDILASMRNLVVAKVCGDGGRELLDLADEEAKEVFDLATKTDTDDAVRVFQGFSKAYDEIAKSGVARTALEMTLVRIARRPPLLPLDDLLVRIGELERRLATSAPPPTRGGGRASASHISSALPAVAQVVAPVVSDVPSSDRTRGALALAPKAKEETPLPPSATREAEPQSVREGLVDFDAWRNLLSRVRAHHTATASIYEHAFVLECTPKRIRLGYAPDNILGMQAQGPAALGLLVREARDMFGALTEVVIDVTVRAHKGATVHALDSAQRKADTAKAKAAVAEHPIVKEAIMLFGAQIRDIKLPGDD